MGLSEAFQLEGLADFEDRVEVGLLHLHLPVVDEVQHRGELGGGEGG